MTHIDVIIQGEDPINFLIQIDSLIQQLTARSNSSNISLEFNPLCGKCINEQLSTQPFSCIDEKQITTIEGVHWEETKSNSNNNNNSRRSKGRSCNNPQRSHLLRREEILFGVPSQINNSK